MGGAGAAKRAEYAPVWSMAGSDDVGIVWADLVWDDLGAGSGDGLVFPPASGSYSSSASAGVFRFGGEVDAGVFAHRHDESSGE